MKGQGRENPNQERLNQSRKSKRGFKHNLESSPLGGGMMPGGVLGGVLGGPRTLKPFEGREKKTE